MRRWIVVALGVANALAFRTAAAQDTMVPRDFVVALLSNQGRQAGAEPDFFGGRVAGPIERHLKLPPGMTVLGTAVWQERTVVVARSALSPDSTKARLAEQLDQLGWMDGGSMMGGGFRPASMRNSSFPDYFCLVDTTLTVVVSPRANSGSDIRITEATNERGMCAPPRARPGERLNLPILYDPGTVRANAPTCDRPSRPLGMRSGGSSSTMIKTTMTLDELLRHYSSQLEASGWTAKVETPPNVVSGTWIRQDPQGRTVETTLRVVADTNVSPCYQVWMETYRTVQ